MLRNAPGTVRDSIVEFLGTTESAQVGEIQRAVNDRLGDVAASSVRSYLNLNVGELFERTSRGQYRLRRKDSREKRTTEVLAKPTVHGNAQLYQADCLEWLRARESNSIHAVITDPPYGLLEYTTEEQRKLRAGRGGVWRIPPAFDGHKRAPLPRFTVLSAEDKDVLKEFFLEFGCLLHRVTVPGANIVIASNPLLTHIVAVAMAEAGLEMRGYIVRLVMTMRGGDRPKNAHEEFNDVSVMPRSMFEPWVVLRKPLEGRAQDNLRKWRTGGFRRVSAEQPFGDLIRSHPTPKREREIAPHPSLKPQAFLRQLVRAALPLAEGIVLDPFAGSGSTLAAANAVGYDSIGVEKDPHCVSMARRAIPGLAAMQVNGLNLA